MKTTTQFCFFASLLFFANRSINAQTSSEQRGEIALTSIRSVLDGEAEQGSTVRLRGTITHQGNPVVLQDQTGAIQIEPSQKQGFVLEDESEVVGRVTQKDGAAVLAAATLQTLWHSSSPLPLAITPDRAADGRYHLYFVQTTGVVDHVETGSNALPFVSLQGDHQFFTARLEYSGDENGGRSALTHLEPGATVRLNGILMASPSEIASPEGGFTVLVRTPEDIQVVHGPSWWTVRHLCFLFGCFSLVGAALQIFYLQQVKRRYRAVLEERARIARDIHDTLAQGYSGIALQLDVVHSRMHHDQEAAGRHLNMAMRMVSHSRAEAHKAILRLRAFSREVPLETMLAEMVEQFEQAPGQKLSLSFATRHDVLLAPHIAEHVYRIVQELVSNAQQHASASLIAIEVCIVNNELSVVVADNGCGMDPELLFRAKPGHFGLLGLRERVSSVKGTVVARSLCPGLAIEVKVPLGEKKGRRNAVSLRSRAYVLSGQRPASRSMDV